MCMVDSADGCDTFSRYVHRKARKSHRCGECGREIPSGETYRYATGLYDGGFWQAKTCAHCEAATRWLLLVCNGWLYGGVWEDLGEHWSEEWTPIKSLDLGRLLVWRNRRWLRPDGTLVDPEEIHEIAVRGGRTSMAKLDEMAKLRKAAA